MMLNETKCTAEVANFNFYHPNYELLIKQRTKNPNMVVVLKNGKMILSFNIFTSF
jgi:hypothetical protein